MPGIFTRPKLSEIIKNSDYTPEQIVDEIFSLYGRSVDDNFVTKNAAKAAEQAAIEAAKLEWEKAQAKPNVKESEEYKALMGEFEGYKARETARRSDDYKDIKPKFFDTVYDKVDRSENAKPISEQMAGFRKDFEEWFNPAEPEPKKPQFGAKPEGSMPKGDEGAVAAMAKAWGLPTAK